MLFNKYNCSRLFFTAFLDVGTLGEEKISSITEESYRAMTSNGDVNLDFHIYKLSFLNFLLGKQPNGPGQFIFGSVVPKVRFIPSNQNTLLCTLWQQRWPKGPSRQSVSVQISRYSEFPKMNVSFLLFAIHFMSTQSVWLHTHSDHISRDNENAFPIIFQFSPL